MHACAVRSGPLKDIDTAFREVNWQRKASTESAKRGEPVSPKIQPAVWQMTLEEYNCCFGMEDEVLDVVTVGNNQQTVFKTAKSVLKPRRLAPSMEVGWTENLVDPLARKEPSV